MTIEQVKELVAMIKALQADDEVAHSYEDALYEAVLKETAKGAENAPQLAKEALKTTKLKFARWCA